DLSTAKGYHPFYFINDEFLYETTEPRDLLPYALSDEWVGYCKSNISRKEAYGFVFESPDMEKLYDGIAGGKSFTMPPTLRNNNMAKYFARSKDIEGLAYLLFAGVASQFYGSEGDGWEVPTGDEQRMDSLIKSGLQAYAHAKKDFIRARYAYQLTRLAFYNNHLADCLRYYEMVKNNPSAGLLRNLSLSFKAGALLKMGKKKEAAYHYSLAFSRSTLRRRSNYISFSQCGGRLNQENRRDCLAFCKSDEERANLLGLFALGSNVPETDALQKIYKLYSRSEMLEILAIREINKIEDNYFSPSLDKQKGGKKLYMDDWYNEDIDKFTSTWRQEAVVLAGYYHNIAQNPAVPNKALFETGAAYLSYITRQYDNANAYLDKAAVLPGTQKIKDQQAMTRLLVTINQRTTIDSSFEAILLPSVQWLEKKARQEGKNVT
ncbi:MAG TPA: hypothetical protein VLD19_21265, partial [Chitinophagaceae bacterium]|nr:hypothetical protein [Chitinophagaceae bacterium]